MLPLAVGSAVGVCGITAGELLTLVLRDRSYLAGTEWAQVTEIIMAAFVFGLFLLVAHAWCVARVERSGWVAASIMGLIQVVTYTALALAGLMVWSVGAQASGDVLLPAWRVMAPVWCIALMSVGFAAWGGDRVVRLAVDRLVKWEIPGIELLPEPMDRGWSAAMLFVGGGLASGLAASVVWYLVGLSTDRMDLGILLGAAVGGGIYFGLTFVLPHSLWRGWIVVLKGARPGWRVPVDASVMGLGERFVGHAPLGSDLHLPAEDGVKALHVSVLARSDGTWYLRGLSRARVQVRRFLQWVTLSWDEQRPAPYETPLSQEDVIDVGQNVQLEFVVIPRTEDS